MGGVDLVTGGLGLPVGPDSKTRQFGELLAAAFPVIGGAKALAGAAAKKGIRAFHGSPHDFDQFSLSKIGTGEGAQAYGHGLYFADSEDVARNYRDALSDADWSIGGKPYDAKNPEHFTAATLSEYPDAATAIKNLRAQITQEKQIKADWAQSSVAQKEDMIRRIEAGGLPAIDEKVKGRMYEVSIHADPEDFLDWDAPLSQQSEKVQRLANERWRMNNEVRPDAPGSVIHRKLGAIGPNSMTARMPPGEQTAEGILKAQGIPGIKYLDGASRSAGQGSRNYVVFDDKLISIVKKYGVAGALSAGLINQAQANLANSKGFQ